MEGKRRNMWISVLFPLLVIAVLLKKAHGSGKLIDPPGRSTAWRNGFTTPVNYNDMNVNCGGYMRQWVQNGGKCGICGDPFDGPRKHEEGGIYDTDTIVRWYVQGDTILAKLDLSAYQRGFFEFFLCVRNDKSTPVTQSCLDQHPLEISNTGDRKYSIQDSSNNADRIYEVSLDLPAGEVCDYCVLQWKHTLGNSWRCDDEPGTGTHCCLGCGPQEQVINCADVRIVQDLSDIPSNIQVPVFQKSVASGTLDEATTQNLVQPTTPSVTLVSSTVTIPSSTPKIEDTTTTAPATTVAIATVTTAPVTTATTSTVTTTSATTVTTSPATSSSASTPETTTASTTTRLATTTAIPVTVPSSMSTGLVGHTTTKGVTPTVPTMTTEAMVITTPTVPAGLTTQPLININVGGGGGGTRIGVPINLSELINSGGSTQRIPSLLPALLLMTSMIGAAGLFSEGGGGGQTVVYQPPQYPMYPVQPLYFKPVLVKKPIYQPIPFAKPLYPMQMHSKSYPYGATGNMYSDAGTGMNGYSKHHPYQGQVYPNSYMGFSQGSIPYPVGTIPNAGYVPVSVNKVPPPPIMPVILGGQMHKPVAELDEEAGVVAAIEEKDKDKSDFLYLHLISPPKVPTKEPEVERLTRIEPEVGKAPLMAMTHAAETVVAKTVSPVESLSDFLYSNYLNPAMQSTVRQIQAAPSVPQNQTDGAPENNQYPGLSTESMDQSSLPGSMPIINSKVL